MPLFSKIGVNTITWEGEGQEWIVAQVRQGSWTVARGLGKALAKAALSTIASALAAVSCYRSSHSTNSSQKSASEPLQNVSHQFWFLLAKGKSLCLRLLMEGAAASPCCSFHGSEHLWRVWHSGCSHLAIPRGVLNRVNPQIFSFGKLVLS